MSEKEFDDLYTEMSQKWTTRFVHFETRVLHVIVHHMINLVRLLLNEGVRFVTVCQLLV